MPATMTDLALAAATEAAAHATESGLKAVTRRRSRLAYLQAAPMALVFLVFLVVPLLLTLTVTDAQGLTDTASVELLPRGVAMTFASNPPGVALTVAGAGVFAPHSQTFIQGSTFNVSAPATPAMSTSPWAPHFRSRAGWSGTPPCWSRISAAAPATSR